MLGPVSVEVMEPLILVYCPATFPNTLTEIVQFAFAESVAPFRLMVVVPDTAVIVPPVSAPVVHAVAKPFGLATNKPVGSVSEKPTPANAVAVLGLVRVNLNVLVAARAIGDVKKLFDKVGKTGRGQPVIEILSRYIIAFVVDGLPEYCPPAAYKRKYTVELLANAVAPVRPVCHALALFHAPDVRYDHVVPFVLYKIYQLPEFDQFPCKL